MDGDALRFKGVTEGVWQCMGTYGVHKAWLCMVIGGRMGMY